MPPAFVDATAVVAAGDDRWAGEIAEGWDIVGNANGGYMLAIAARALGEATGRPDPVTVTGHYLSPGKPGPIEITTRVVKAGRRFTTAHATLVAGDRPVLTVLGTFGDLGAPGEDPELVRGAPPDLPPVDECVALRAASPFPPPFMDRVELRLHPDDANFRDGAPSGEPRMRGWFRLRDGEPIDTVALLCAVDAFPPTAFNARLPVAWTPTVELTAHVRSRPVPGWLSCAFSTRFVTSGFLEADGEVWDGAGRLVAQSRQLALVPRPPA
jgi:acyl-coenzyme A thioesterase PaaI-like protein